MANDDITLQDAADELGVHYMTAYRYVRLGKLAATKRSGKWYIARRDLERLLASGTPPPSGPPERRVRDWDGMVPRLQGRMLDGDQPGAWAIVEAALAGGASPAEVHVHLIAPVLRAVGADWAEGRIDVGEEHRASQVAVRLVGRLGPHFARRGRRRGTVVVAGVPGDTHGLPVLLVADVLRGAGFDVVDLGADTPTGSIVAAIRATSPLAVALSASTGGRQDDIRATVAAVHVAFPGLPVLLGGPAVGSEEEAAALGGDAWAADALGAVALVEQLRAGR